MEKLKEMASALLTEEYFWSIIENSDKVALATVI